MKHKFLMTRFYSPIPLYLFIFIPDDKSLYLWTCLVCKWFWTLFKHRIHFQSSKTGHQWGNRSISAPHRKSVLRATASTGSPGPTGPLRRENGQTWGVWWMPRPKLGVSHAHLLSSSKSHCKADNAISRRKAETLRLGCFNWSSPTCWELE